MELKRILSAGDEAAQLGYHLGVVKFFLAAHGGRSYTVSCYLSGEIPASPKKKLGSIATEGRLAASMGSKKGWYYTGPANHEV